METISTTNQDQNQSSSEGGEGTVASHVLDSEIIPELDADRDEEEEPYPLRKAEIEERLEKVALDGLANLYHAITGKECEKYVALGMATSAVSTLKHSHAQLKEELLNAAKAVHSLGNHNNKDGLLPIEDCPHPNCIRRLALATKENQ